MTTTAYADDGDVSRETPPVETPDVSRETSAEPTPPPRSERARQRTAAARKAASSRTKTATEAPPRTKTPRAKSTVDYTPAIAGLLQLPAFALTFGSRYQPDLALDAMAISLHTPGIATAVNAMAQEDEQLAALLDRILKVGPYGALLAAVTPLALQIAANHRMLPANPDVGILTPDQLMAAANPDPS
jgi:hypothetical protein